MASVVFSLLHSLRFMIRSRLLLHLEIIALRHLLAVVNRSRCPRLRLTPVDRTLWAWLSRSWCGYIAYYLRSRTHLALGKDAPVTHPVSPLSAGRIVATPEVGGLHRYDRIAA